MNRRTYLVSVGATATAALGGCLAAPNDPSSGGPREFPEPSGTLTEDPRVDEPPYSITVPDVEDEGAWDDTYLCGGMETDSEVDMERLDVPVPFSLTNASLDENEYRIQLIATPERRDEAFDNGVADGLSEIDFDTHVLLIVESGYGSGSVQHHWGRIDTETTEDATALHIHGCYTDPVVQTDDITSHSSVLKVKRPELNSPLYARASLTVEPARRVTFNSTEGVVTLDR